MKYHVGDIIKYFFKDPEEGNNTFRVIVVDDVKGSYNLDDYKNGRIITDVSESIVKDYKLCINKMKIQKLRKVL